MNELFSSLSIKIQISSQNNYHKLHVVDYILNLFIFKTKIKKYMFLCLSILYTFV